MIDDGWNVARVLKICARMALLSAAAKVVRWAA
jgi:hypothetical protein